MVRIIINSDDFGLNKAVNNAISAAFKENLITSTTSLVNFKEGLKDAVNLVNNNLIPKDSIGIHLNLTEGSPVSKDGTNCTRLCENGKFHGRIRNTPVFKLNTDEKSAILAELESQISKFISTFGFVPSHIDGHHHIHTEWAILNIVIKLAKKHHIKKIRLTRNIGNGISPSKNIYKKILNLKLKFSGFVTTDYFGDFNDLSYFSIPQKCSLEIMVHALPASIKDQINDIDEKSLAKKVQNIKSSNNYGLINYSQL